MKHTNSPKSVRSILRKYLNKRNIIDENLGLLQMEFDSLTSTFSLSKKIDFGTFTQLTLYLENHTEKASLTQIDFLNSILNQSAQIIRQIQKAYSEEYNTDILQEYAPVYIILNDSNHQWELWFERIQGFENCIFYFNNLTAVGFSFQA